MAPTLSSQEEANAMIMEQIKTCEEPFWKNHCTLEKHPLFLPKDDCDNGVYLAKFGPEVERPDIIGKTIIIIGGDVNIVVAAAFASDEQLSEEMKEIYATNVRLFVQEANMNQKFRAVSTILENFQKINKFIFH